MGPLSECLSLSDCLKFSCSPPLHCSFSRKDGMGEMLRYAGDAHVLITCDNYQASARGKEFVLRAGEQTRRRFPNNPNDWLLGS